MFTFIHTSHKIKGIRILCLGILINIVFNSNSSAQTLEWAKSFGSIYSDYATSMTVDASGNVYTTGNFDETVDFDPGQNTFMRSPKGNSDIFVHKMDAQGNLLWVKTFGSTSGDSGNGIVVDHEGNVYITGYFADNISFDSTTNNYVFPTHGSGDIFILKLDSLGNTLWAKTLGSTMYDTGISITLDQSGNIYTAGRFQDNVDFDPGLDTFLAQSNGKGDIFIHKMDVNGNFLWAKTIGSVNTDYLTQIIIDVEENVLLIGEFSGTIDFDPGIGEFMVTSTGNAGGFLLKLNPEGNFMWAKVLEGSEACFYNSISINDLGNILATGFFKGSIYFNLTSGTTTYHSAGNWDIFEQKLDNDGHVIWANTLGNTGKDVGTCITSDANGNVYTMGVFAETVDFDESPAIANLTSEGKDDIFIRKTDSDGHFLWAQSFGGIDDDFVYSMFVDPKGNIYATGTFIESLSLSQGEAPVIFNSVGNDDVFIIKYNQIISGTSNESSQNNLSVYPNASSGLIHVSLGKTFSKAELVLTDVNGRVLHTKTLENVSHDQFQIDGPTGIYFLHIKTQESRSIIKVVKE